MNHRIIINKRKMLPWGQTSVSIRGVLLFLGLGLALPSFFVNSPSFNSMISDDDSEIVSAFAFG